MPAVVGPLPYTLEALDGAAQNGIDLDAQKSDTVNLTVAVRGIYVGSAGNVSLLTPAGTTLTYIAPQVGQILPVCAIRIRNTSTTAAGLIGII